MEAKAEAATMTRREHPLLRPFPLVVMTLATFLVVFALLMARLTAGVDPVVGAIAASARVSAGGGEALRTRASGAAALATRSVSSAGEGRTAPTTRTSGAVTMRTGVDD